MKSGPMTGVEAAVELSLAELLAGSDDALELKHLERAEQLASGAGLADVGFEASYRLNALLLASGNATTARYYERRAERFAPSAARCCPNLRDFLSTRGK